MHFPMSLRTANARHSKRGGGGGGVWVSVEGGTCV